MLRSSQQRSSRCKDLKVKRALQICVVLGVCIWMVYLVQHSREKERSYGEGTKQSSIIDARDKDEKDEEQNMHEKQKKTGKDNSVENENLTQKNEQINNEEKSEHRKDPIDQDTEESFFTIKESQEKENEDNKNKVEEDKKKSDQIQKVDSSEDRVHDQNSKRNNEEAKEEYYASNEGLNKTKQSHKRENDEFELKSQADGTEVAHVHQNEKVLNVTQQNNTTQVTNSVVTKTNQGNGSENQYEKEDDSPTSSIVESENREQEPNKLSSDDIEALHLLNGTDTNTTSNSNTIEKQLGAYENSKVEDSIFHNKTLKKKDPESDAALEQVDSILANSSGPHERNVTNGEYNGKVNAKDKGHVGTESASDSSVVEGKDASSENNDDDVAQVENEKIDTSENEDRVQKEHVESQEETEESAH